MNKIYEWWIKRKIKSEKRKINMIRWGVQLYVLKGLEKLIEKDLWNYLNSVNPDYCKNKLVNIVSECNSDCLDIYLDFPKTKLGDYENREIAHIHSEDALFVLKKYNNRSRIYKKTLLNYLKELDCE